MNEPVAWFTPGAKGVPLVSYVPMSSKSYPVYAHPQPDHTAVMRQAVDALEIGYESVRAEAAAYHAAMAGYRRQRHDDFDANVQQIAGAITALRAALGERA